MIGFLWAEDEQHLIGANGTLPWHLPADMRYFKELTTGHTVVMGRKTFESIPNPPLPGRETFVLTHEKHPFFENMAHVTVFHDLDQLLSALLSRSDQVFVIGGASLFHLLMPIVTDLFVTKIAAVFTGDVYMPAINYHDFKLVDKKLGQVDEKNVYPHEFLHYQRQ